jgi:hypothetical protein
MRHLFILFVIVLAACKEKKLNQTLITANDLHLANEMLLDISMMDVFSPPVASRVFVYPNLAAFEIYGHKKGVSLLNDLTPNTMQLTKLDSTKLDYACAAVIGYHLIAKKMVFTEAKVDDHLAALKARLIKLGYSESNYKQAYNYAQTQCKSISSWIDKDNYAQVKADDQFTLGNADSSWILTPPNFESALEPNWYKLRPIFLNDLKDFYAKARPQFSTNKNSEFFKQALLVYEQSKKSKEAEHSIAKHWDCNPNERIESGHNTYFQHKISPPGHWINITQMLATQSQANFEKTIVSYALVSSSIFDGLISCWQVKFKDQLIRPVTYINRYIDKNWEPYIQTPPFPEYTSGHSVVSGAASTILAKLYSNASFVDSTEVQFGLPARKFYSIEEAAKEASLSRFYGGIHYKFGIDNGLQQGQKIGNYILDFFYRTKKK